MLNHDLRAQVCTSYAALRTFFLCNGSEVRFFCRCQWPPDSLLQSITLLKELFVFLCLGCQGEGSSATYLFADIVVLLLLQIQLL